MADADQKRPRIGRVAAWITGLVLIAVVLGTVLPVQMPTALDQVLTRAGLITVDTPGPPPAMLLVVARDPVRGGPWRPLEGSELSDDADVRLDGARPPSAVRYVLRGPGGVRTEAVSDAPSYRANLPMGSASAGAWRLEVLPLAARGPVLASADFTVPG